MPRDPALSLPLVVGGSDAGLDRSPLQAEVTACFDAWRRPLMRYLLACRVDTSDAEEIVQEVFLALFRHLAADKPRGHLRGWVFRVAHNLMLKRRPARRHALAPAIVAAGRPEADVPDPEPGPEDQLRSKQRQARLLAVVAALPDRERECLHLRAEGLKYREIADVLGISLGAVALALSRAIGRLARADEG